MFTFPNDMSNEDRRNVIVEALKANKFVAITYAKASGEITTRVATIIERPDDQAPKGVRATNPDNFRYFECGAENRFDDTAKGDWKSFKLANAKSVAPAAEPEGWND